MPKHPVDDMTPEEMTRALIAIYNQMFLCGEHGRYCRDVDVVGVDLVEAAFIAFPDHVKPKTYRHEED